MFLSNIQYVLCFLFIAVPANVLHAQQDEKQSHNSNAIRGAVARMNGIFSGRMTYEKKSSASTKDQSFEYTLVFSGQSWKNSLKYDISTVKRIYSDRLLKSGFDATNPPELNGEAHYTVVSHRGRRTEYKITPQMEGDNRMTAEVMTGSEAIEDQYPPLPPYAGTFWFQKTLKYVSENQSKAKFVRVDKVDGYDVVVYEWEVPKTEIYNAFDSANKITDKGGVLRVYIAPALGYVVPKVEHVGISNKPGKILTAVDFKEYNGVYIPGSARIQNYNEKGPSSHYQYDIIKIADINEPIPESEFILTLPVGTEVADSTSGTTSDFFTVTDDPNTIPDDLLNSIQTPKKSFVERWGWPGAVGLGILLGLVILGGLYMVRRLRSRRAAV